MGLFSKSRNPGLPTGHRGQIVLVTEHTVEADVVGESFHADNFNRLFSGKNVRGSDERELFLPAVLIAETNNRYDKNAVAVFVNGLQLGHLDKARAANYHGPLMKLSSRGTYISMNARQWARGIGPDIFASIRLQLPPVGALPA